jgi:UDP-2,3-diacylglucosamine hydrolase
MGEVLGLIAGSGRLPFAVARAARAEGYRVVAVGHKGQTAPELEREVDAFEWVWLGQLRRIAEILGARGARRAIMGGGLAKGASFTSARPDLVALKLWATLGRRGDDRILRTIADWFQGEGIEIVAPDGLLAGCFAEEGHLAGPKPQEAALADAREGFRVARVLGELDVGQTVAVREGVVLAVEAMEGTDACIRRAGDLAEGAVIVKASKPGQDRRFDMPAVGPDTIAVLAAARARLLALEAGATLILDRGELATAAKANKIPVVGLRP